VTSGTARFLGALAGLLVRAYRRLYRTVSVGEERIEAARRPGQPLLYVLWHGRMLAPILHHRDQRIATMASRSTDGEIITRMLGTIGYVVARGSTGKGGGRALRELIDLVRDEGRDAALTVDGPRGPAGKVQPGAANIARETGALVVPISCACRRGHHFASWDRFLVPLPFDTAWVAHGEPFVVDVGTDDAVAAERIANAIELATAEAEELRARAAAPADRASG